jgi:hypothetical protein
MLKANFTATVAARWAGAMLSAISMVSTASAAADSPEARVLSSSRLCEASAALIVDCPGSSGSCLLVGDNEQEKRLFWFKLSDDGDVDVKTKKELKLTPKDVEIGDIEALAKLPDGRIVAFGSHSRNTKCQAEPDRRTFGVIDQLANESASVSVTKTKSMDCDALFGADRAKTSRSEAACKAIKKAETAADKAANDEEKCNDAHAYNAEGAVNVSKTGVPDIWIGLRAPLLKAPTENLGLAILMHMKTLGAYSFDKVAALDLKGFGIRDLAYDGTDGLVWVIAGPPQDLGEKEDVKFQLWKFDAKKLHANAIIKPERVRDDLPTSSEGLALLNDKFIVLVDGGETKGQDKCKKSAGFLILPRPPLTPR